MAKLRISVTDDTVSGIQTDFVSTNTLPAKTILLDGVMLANWLTQIPPQTLSRALFSLREMQYRPVEEFINKYLNYKQEQS